MSSQGKQYEYLDHTADIKFQAFGKTREEVFENAALAMFNVIIDTEKVSGDTAREIVLKSPDLESLLVDWLSELLYLFEVDEIVFRDFRVKIIREVNGEYSITAQALGENYSLESLPFETEIKAVTYNQLEITKTADGWKAQVVVDI
ncbi:MULTISPECIES: archease [Methanosarcina]|uniref:Protein archease n=3 Tax=Methanosarcina barkeri TaxID=2208 RepID=A0A0E3QSD1_METBA|nr:MULTISPECIES: archease [Methanosarcina]AKB53348.1 Archease [Methanosarcina barkeri MS]AKB58548.1 Archease [Methanosarcina barkeri 227]AKJ39340.1 archease family protein [Methanosarcina barkeri CM1]OED05686.1 archease [Methanosarcina sp. A14]